MKNNSTIEDLLNELDQKSTIKGALMEALVDSTTGSLYRYIQILVNGRDIAFLTGQPGLGYKLQDRDVVTIIPPASGG